MQAARQLQQQGAQGAPPVKAATAPASKAPAPSRKQTPQQQQQTKSAQKAQHPPQSQARSLQEGPEQGVQDMGKAGNSPGHLWEAGKDAEALGPTLRDALGVFQQGRLDVRIFME